MQNWPGAAWYEKNIRNKKKSMLTIIPGWNVDAEGNRTKASLENQDLSLASYLLSKRTV